MKLINNQDTLLIDEINRTVNSGTSIYLSCDHFTSFGLFDLIDSFKNANQIKILLSYNFNEKDDFRFIQNIKEGQYNLLLDRKYRNNEVIELIQNKCCKNTKLTHRVGCKSKRVKMKGEGMF